MKKNDIFNFTTPNGVEITAVVVEELNSNYSEKYNNVTKEWLCYSQNRLFTYYEQFELGNGKLIKSWYGKVLVDYAILPEYDSLLESYSDHQVTLAEEQSGM